MLILIDLDKTLIDGSYKLTSDKIKEAIASAISAGHQIGLSSDSSAASLWKWRQHLGMNGPVLAERGSVLQLLDKDGPIPTGSAFPSIFAALRARMMSKLIEGVPSLDLILCDPAEAIREQRYRSAEPRLIGFINAHRLCSFHVSFRWIDATGTQKLDETTKSCVYKAKEIFQQDCLIEGRSLDGFFIDANLEYGLLILHDVRSDKRFGTETILRTLKLNTCAVIGDGENDFTGLPNVQHWAVENAKPGYKTHCERVATTAFTEGVVELLSSLPVA